MDQRSGDSTLYYRARRFFCPLLGLIACSLCLQLAGFASPGWVILKHGHQEVQTGLWIIRACYKDVCETKTIDEVNSLDILADGLTEYRVETSIALGLVTIALIVGVFSRTPGRLQHISFGVIFLTLISGILALIAAGKIGDNTRKASDRLKELRINSDIAIHVPYSIILTGLGGILACIATLVSSLGVKPCSSESVPQQSSQMTSPSSVPQLAHQMTSPHSQDSPEYPSQPYAAQPYHAQSYLGQPYIVQPGFTPQKQQSVYENTSYY